MQTNFDFDGKTYDATFDQKRLSTQFVKVLNLMIDGQWRTLQDISAQTGYPITSISARLRDMRKARFGSFTVERERTGNTGLFTYRVVR